MGTFLNEVLIDSKCLDKKEYIDYVARIMGRNNPDYDYDDLLNVGGYVVLPIFDESIDCLKLGIDIANKMNTITISIYIYDSDFSIFQLVDDDIIIRILLNKKLALSYHCDIKNQNVNLLVNYVNSNNSTSDIEEIIDSEYIFVEDGLSKILDLFHINFNEIVY